MAEEAAIEIDGATVQVKVGQARAGTIMEAVRRLDGARHRMPTTSRCAEPTLDDVFLALTGRELKVEDEAAKPAPTRTRRWPHEALPSATP